MTAKRFTVVYNEQCKMMQYVDNKKEEPNRWAIWNASETANKMNDLHEENQALKRDLARYKEESEKNKQLKNRSTEKPNCGYCKYLQIDGMFGMWCDKGRNWENTDAEYCPNYER